MFMKNYIQYILYRGNVFFSTMIVTDKKKLWIPKLVIQTTPPFKWLFYNKYALHKYCIKIMTVLPERSFVYLRGPYDGTVWFLVHNP